MAYDPDREIKDSEAHPSNVKPKGGPRAITVGICDLCNGAIDHGEGFVFYSAAVFSRNAEETGLMHLCASCTAENVNETRFQENTIRSSSMKVNKFLRNPEKAFDWMKEGNAAGIIILCTSLGLTSGEAADKAREFARKVWVNKEKAVEEAARFWTSRRLPGGAGASYARTTDAVKRFLAFSFEKWASGELAPRYGRGLCVLTNKRFNYQEGNRVWHTLELRDVEKYDWISNDKMKILLKSGILLVIKLIPSATGSGFPTAPPEEYVGAYGPLNARTLESVCARCGKELRGVVLGRGDFKRLYMRCIDAYGLRETRRAVQVLGYRCTACDALACEDCKKEALGYSNKKLFNEAVCGSCKAPMKNPDFMAAHSPQFRERGAVIDDGPSD